MQPLRVSITTHLFPSESTELSGPWLAEQVDALAPHVDVTVLAALRRCRRRDTVRPSGVTVSYRPTAVLPGLSRAALFASTARYAWVARRYFAALGHRPDLIHAHFGFPDAVVTAPIARRLGVPFVATLHGDDAFSLMHRSDLLGRWVRDALHAADAVICVSPAMYDAVRPGLSDSVRVLMIENGYDDSLFTLHDATRTGGILFVGTLTKVKNVDVLLRAYAGLDGAPRLTLVGDGQLRGDLERLAGELGVADRVDFIGAQPRERVAELMRGARAVVLPSSSEGYGLVAAESLATGTPVVASEVGGLPHILASKAGGVLVRPGSVESLAAGLRTVLGGAYLPVDVAAASSAVGWSERVRELLTLYIELTDDRGPR